MKINKNLVLLILLILVMLTEPIPLNGVYNTFYGKVLVLGLVVYFTINHTVLGLLAVIILISSLQVTAEGLTIKGREGFTSSLPVISGRDRLRVEELFRPKILNRSAFKNIVRQEPQPMSTSNYL